MIATILHWPWRLDGAKDWSQGLWRAQAGAQVLEFFGTKPSGDWGAASAALLEQLQTAMAAGKVTVIDGPPLPTPPDPAARQAAETAADTRRINQAIKAIVREQEADDRARHAAQAPTIQQLSLLP